MRDLGAVAARGPAAYVAPRRGNAVGIWAHARFMVDGEGGIVGFRLRRDINRDALWDAVPSMNSAGHRFGLQSLRRFARWRRELQGGSAASALPPRSRGPGPPYPGRWCAASRASGSPPHDRGVAPEVLPARRLRTRSLWASGADRWDAQPECGLAPWIVVSRRDSGLQCDMIALFDLKMPK